MRDPGPADHRLARIGYRSVDSALNLCAQRGNRNQQRQAGKDWRERPLHEGPEMGNGIARSLFHTQLQVRSPVGLHIAVETGGEELFVCDRVHS